MAYILGMGINAVKHGNISFVRSCPGCQARGINAVKHGNISFVRSCPGCQARGINAVKHGNISFARSYPGYQARGINAVRVPTLSGIREKVRNSTKVFQGREKVLKSIKGPGRVGKSVKTSVKT